MYQVCSGNNWAENMYYRLNNFKNFEEIVKDSKKWRENR